MRCGPGIISYPTTMLYDILREQYKETGTYQEPESLLYMLHLSTLQH
jgi:hypothetical protein